MSPLAEILAAVRVLTERPELVLIRDGLAAPLIDWLERRAVYASAYTEARHQEVAAGAAAVTFAREVNTAADRAPAALPATVQKGL